MEAVENSLSFARRHPAMRLVGIIWGGVAAGLAFASTLVEIPTELGPSGMVVLILGLISLALASFAFVLEYVLTQRRWARDAEAFQKRLSQLGEQIEEKNRQIDEQKRIKIPDDTRQRFEEIERKGVRLGWIQFRPTLVVDPGGKQVGAGPGLLNEIFNGNIKYTAAESSWANVISNLNAGEYDVIATPLYDIRERREHVEFTTPIFYADIGIFASRDNAKIHEALDRRTELTFPEVTDRLKPMTNSLQFCVHPGELQDKMILKYFKGSSVNEADIAYFSIKAALTAMVNNDQKYRSDLYFCERIQGEEHYLFQSGELVNLLAAGQLLFPVGFALRRGDDTLRKYMNLRLMTIEGEQGSGIQKQLLQHTTHLVQPGLVNKLGEYFLRRRILPERKAMDEGKGNVFNLKK